MNDHQRFMGFAYQEALKALDEGEVPVGAVIVQENRVIGRGYNRIEKLSDATAHAEIIAISAASNATSSWRLDNCTLYVTLEPCLMCLGAILQSRIDTIVFGAEDPRAGAVVTHRFRNEVERAYQWYPAVMPGIMGNECSRLIASFFSALRKKN